jgi:type IV pilus assembly protein PilP
MKKRLNKQIQIPALLIMALLVCFGCKKKDTPPPPPSVPKPVVRPVQPVQTQASSAKTVVTVDNLLDFSNKKDPFKPFSVEPAHQGQPRPAGIVRTGDLLPIQSYDVNKFKVSGIITGLKENTALVIDPAGKGYVVKEGMLIGINDGRINRITPSAIEVIEQYRDDNGHLRKRSILLSMPKKK